MVRQVKHEVNTWREYLTTYKANSVKEIKYMCHLLYIRQPSRTLTSPSQCLLNVPLFWNELAGAMRYFSSFNHFCYIMLRKCPHLWKSWRILNYYTYFKAWFWICALEIQFNIDWCQFVVISIRLFIYEQRTRKQICSPGKNNCPNKDTSS